MLVIPMTQCSDNFQFDITAWEGHHDFDMLGLCLKLAFAGHATASHWSEQKGVLAQIEHGRRKPMWQTPPQLVLHWTGNLSGKAELTKFLAPLDWEAATTSVHAWLRAQDYANEPDHDGDNSKGWRIYNEHWGHIGGHHGAICAVEPAWLMHGK